MATKGTGTMYSHYYSGNSYNQLTNHFHSSEFTLNPEQLAFLSQYKTFSVNLGAQPTFI